MPNPDYLQFGFGKHNGIDVLPGIAKLVRAPFDFEHIETGNQITGGGIYNGILSKHIYTFPNGLMGRVLWDSLHLERSTALIGKTGRAGDIVGIADNTGFSTGIHTHFQPRKVSYNGNKFTFLEKNDAHDSFDPMPFIVPAPPVSFATDLYEGMSGPEVRKLQIVLFGLGYFDYPEFTEYYGPATKAAAFKFQLAKVPLTLLEKKVYQGKYFGPKSRFALNKILNGAV